MTLKIGPAEVYRLTASITREGTLIADFCPMSLFYSTQKPFADGIKEMGIKSATNWNYYPTLAATDVQLLLDGKPLTIETISKRPSSMDRYVPNAGTRPYYTVEARLPKDGLPGTHTVTVIIRASHRDKFEKEVVERGQSLIDIVMQ